MPPYNATSWKSLVHCRTSEAEFYSPADEGHLVAVERSFGVKLPPSLREFLRETDGLMAKYSKMIWSIGEIERWNQEFRTNRDFFGLYMPFDHLLFFGDDGSGDQFAFAIDADGEIRRWDIYRWEHETDSRSWFAGHLERFFERRLPSVAD